MPKPKPLAGRVALITGGAGGIGLATARRLMDEGACVVLCDIDREALARAENELRERYSSDVVASAWVDVTREDAVAAGFRDSAWKFGGVDICVSNAGICVGLAGRRDQSRDLAEEHGHPGRRAIS
jgi:NAD(P)-dependent dehydrogenase (short-subunit alcohol dehydrogenase family)